MSQHLNIYQHSIWKNISVFKKPIHLGRIYLARQLAKIYPQSMFIGVTGSVGKTTTTSAITAVLSEKFKTVSTFSNLNLDPILNIPITILKIRPNTQKVVLEMGVEYPGEMDFYLSIIQPNIAVVTRIFYAHSEFLGTLEEIIEEKSQLVRNLPKNGTAILNWDDLNTRKLAEKTKAKIIFFGSSKKDCHVWSGNIRLENFKTHFELNYGVERVDIIMPLLGKHLVTSALAAAAVGINEGLNLINIKAGIEKIIPSPHRLEVLEGLNGQIILDDTYNSSPIALEEAINVLNELTGKKRVVVLGEMKELGEFSEKLHRGIAQKIYKDKIDLVLLSTGETEIIYDELKRLGYPEDRMEVNLSSSQIVTSILKYTKEGDLVLIKGSRSVRLDEVVGRVTKK